MDLLRQIAAVAGVLLLLGAALHWLRARRPAPWFAGRAGGRRLETIERLPLSPQHTLHLVRLDSRTMLVAAGPNGCTLLDAPPPEPVALEPGW
jgi:hypothetical protein